MLIQGQVGPIGTTASLSAGTQAPMRQGNMGENIVSEYQGPYGEATYRRQTYVVANQAGVTHVAGFGPASYIGLCIGNPATSTINMHVIGFCYALTVALAAVSVIGIMTGVGTITAALTPRNRYVGGAAGQGLATGGQNPLPGTPVLEQVFSSLSTLAAASWMLPGPNWVDLKGSLILPPNTFVASYMSAASGASGFFGSFLWQEIPI